MSDNGDKNIYWKGKCEVCCYSCGFSTAYGLYWGCSKYKTSMANVQSQGGCSGPFQLATLPKPENSK